MVRRGVERVHTSNKCPLAEGEDLIFVGGPSVPKRSYPASGDPSLPVLRPKNRTPEPFLLGSLLLVPSP